MEFTHFDPVKSLLLQTRFWINISKPIAKPVHSLPLGYSESFYTKRNPTHVAFYDSIMIFGVFGRLPAPKAAYTHGRTDARTEKPRARDRPPLRARAPTTLKICPVLEAVSPPTSLQLFGSCKIPYVIITIPLQKVDFCIKI